MRLWHYELLPYLPDAQFKGQLRELVAIMYDWRDKGQTNHLLINRVMDYPKRDLFEYYLWYKKNMRSDTIKNYLHIMVNFIDFVKMNRHYTYLIDRIITGTTKPIFAFAWQTSMRNISE